eukprot:gene12123-biopygen16914
MATHPGVTYFDPLLGPLSGPGSRLGTQKMCPPPPPSLWLPKVGVSWFGLAWSWSAQDDLALSDIFLNVLTKGTRKQELRKVVLKDTHIEAPGIAEVLPPPPSKVRGRVVRSLLFDVSKRAQVPHLPSHCGGLHGPQHPATHHLLWSSGGGHVPDVWADNAPPPPTVHWACRAHRAAWAGPAAPPRRQRPLPTRPRDAAGQRPDYANRAGGRSVARTAASLREPVQPSPRPMCVQASYLQWRRIGLFQSGCLIRRGSGRGA